MVVGGRGARSFRMAYLLEMVADNRLTDWWLFQEIEVAENKYCRAFAAVIQESPTRRADGKFVQLIGCFLYEVPDVDLKTAKAMVKHNKARRLQSSDDWCCGPPIVIEGLFRVIH
jgi:hypothetical protein